MLNSMNRAPETFAPSTLQNKARSRNPPMPLDPFTLLAAGAMGLGATFSMDLWNLLLKRAFGIPSLNLCLLGRWVGHLTRGTLAHANIAAARETSHECAVGWITHYTIGVVLAVGFVLLAPATWVARPTLGPALAYGVATVVFPFFVMQPSFGLGVASARTPRPARARIKSLVTHAVFGAGLYVWGIGVSSILRGTHS